MINSDFHQVLGVSLMVWNVRTQVSEHTFLGTPEDKLTHTQNKRRCVSRNTHIYQEKMCRLKEKTRE